MTSKLNAIDYTSGLASFDISGKTVIVDTNANDVVPDERVETLVASAGWMKVAPYLDYPSSWREIAEASVSPVDVDQASVGETQRKFRVPASVKNEVRQALSWVTENDVRITSIAQALANRLLDETYVYTEDVVRMQRYFGRLSYRSNERAGWTSESEGYPSSDRVAYGIRGGTAGETWVNKITTKHSLSIKTATPVDDDAEQTAVVASAFDFDASCNYYARTVEPGSDLVDGLIVEQPDGTWAERVDNDWSDIDPPSEFPSGDEDDEEADGDTDTFDMYDDFPISDDDLTGPLDPDGDGDDDSDVPLSYDMLIPIDEDTAYALADLMDDVVTENPDALPTDIKSFEPHESAMYALAKPEIDFEMLDRVFDIYDSAERSANAGKQVRGPGGKFGDEPDHPGAQKQTTAQTKARLPQALPLLPDPAARIAQYLAENGVTQDAPAAPAPGVTASYVNTLIDFADAAPAPAADPAPADAAPAAAPAAATPLYLAIVDKVDTAAVLDVVSLMAGPPPVMWKRDNGQWVQAPDILTAMQSASPPPVVELTDPATVKSVVEQVDQSTAGGADTTDEAPAPGATEQAPDGSSGPAPDANPDQHPVTASGHDVIFVENRRTPKVVPTGKKYKPKPSEGRIVKRRAATKEEEKTIRSGGWVRVNEHGKTPKDKDYKSSKKSKIRPQHNSSSDPQAHIESVYADTEMGRAELAAHRKSSDFVKCPRCGSQEVSHLMGGDQPRCAKCGYHVALKEHSIDGISVPPSPALPDRSSHTELAMWGPNGEMLNVSKFAEGGADKNRGNAEKLRNYWVHGEGAAKIKWGTGGDWYRCVDHLSKYLGVRAKGYCTLRHHDATGAWPGHGPGDV